MSAVCVAVYNGGVDLAQVADELYALDPAEFTAARDERARSARATGEKGLGDAIKRLRRPTVSASLVNRLVREAADQVDRLLGLGESLREAQQTLAGDELRRLSAQRRPVIHALAQEAKRLSAEAGRPVSDQAEREVEATLEAALADPAAADAVRSGRLTSALVYAGFGGVDVADAVAVPDAVAVSDGAAVPEAAAPPERARRPGPDVRRSHAAPAQEQQTTAVRGARKAGAGEAERRTDRAGEGERKDGAGARERQEAEAARERREAEGAARDRREAEGAARERREAETVARHAQEAEADARDAADGLDDAARRVSEVRSLRQVAKRRIEELEQQLEQAQAHEAEASRVLRDAERRRDVAARLADEAQRRLARARAKAEASLEAYRQRPPPRG